jgi:hypothetical protein
MIEADDENVSFSKTAKIMLLLFKTIPNSLYKDSVKLFRNRT